MQISSRFTIAVHVLIAIETFKNERKVTSEFLASSANVNPTVIRRLLQQLKKADIVTVKRGSGGAAGRCCGRRTGSGRGLFFSV